MLDWKFINSGEHEGDGNFTHTNGISLMISCIA